MRLTPGMQLGPYEVVAVLGAGGMAEVYRARDTRLGREVALKVMGAAPSGDGDLLRRFEQEARLASSLNHPNVVALFDVGLHQGAPYFVTELLQGETLRQRLAKGPVPLQTALDWAVQIARGLAAAHERGIVHRDLKPENVFLTRAGHVKLLDFGIAKLTQSTPPPGAHGLMEETLTPGGSATRTGLMIGTPGYMSPEQVRGDPVDARTDLFSFGSVLYELLTGHRAFPASTVVEAGYAILHSPPEPLPATVPPQIARLVTHCLEKGPDDRVQSARDLAFDLELLSDPGGRQTTQLSPKATGGRRRPPWLVPLLLWTLAISVVPVAYLTGASSSSEHPPKVRQVTFLRGAVLSARFAPDARTVLFGASLHGEPPQIYSTTLDSPEFHSLGIEDAELLAVSSVGELAVLVHPRFRRRLIEGRGMLARVPGVGGTPRQLVDDVSYADWTADGISLALIRRVGETSRLELPEGHVLHQTTGWLSHARISPRGDRVAFIEHPDPSDSMGTVAMVDLAGKKRVLSPDWNEVLGLAWSPRGDEVWFSSLDDAGTGSLWAVSLDGTKRLLYQGLGRLILQDVSRQGRVLVLTAEARGHLMISTQGVDRSLSWLDETSLNALSADGTRVLFTEGGLSSTARVYPLYLRKTDGSPPARLGAGPGLALSPDGKWALVSSIEVPGKVWLLPTGAGTQRTVDVAPLEAIRFGAFFPDGEHVALNARERGGPGFRIYIASVSTGQPRPITPTVDPRSVEVSPDGKLVATIGLDGRPVIYPVDGGSALPLPELSPGWAPVGWSRDGGLLVRPLNDIPATIYRFDLGTRKRSLVTTLGPRDLTGVTNIARVLVTPDERTAAYYYQSLGTTLYQLDWGPDGPVRR